MEAIALAVSIAVAHVAVLYGVYATGFLGLSWRYGLEATLGFGVPTVAAGIGYSLAVAKLPWFAGQAAYRRHLFAIAAAAISLYLGVFLAFNSLGT